MESYNDDKKSWSVDINSIQRNDNIVTFWCRREYLTADSRKEYIDWNLDFLKKYDYPQGVPYHIYEKWLKFKEIKNQEKINCENKTHATISRVEYDEQGKVIDSYSYTNIKWDAIVPESVFETVYEIVCFKQSQNDFQFGILWTDMKRAIHESGNYHISNHLQNVNEQAYIYYDKHLNGTYLNYIYSLLSDNEVNIGTKKEFAQQMRDSIERKAFYDSFKKNHYNRLIQKNDESTLKIRMNFIDYKKFEENMVFDWLSNHFIYDYGYIYGDFDYSIIIRDYQNNYLMYQEIFNLCFDWQLEQNLFSYRGINREKFIENANEIFKGVYIEDI